MSLRDAWNDGLDWAGEKLDDVKEYATDKIIDYKVGKYVDSFTDEFKGPTTITPEMAAEGWKPGLDGVPYNSKLNEKFEPGGIFYDPDVDKNTAMANAVASGQVSSAEAGSTPFELSQDLSQRTPSGTIYNPSMEEYNNASLFDYKGPGGVPEYTYGEALKTDYGTYGTPPGPNLYYEGQYGEGTVETPGVADGGIKLPPITMPAGVPQVPSTTTTNTNTNNNTSSNTNTNTGNNLYSSGMDSGLLSSYINESGIGNATQGSGMGYSSGANEPGIGSATQGSGMGYSGGANEPGIIGTQQYLPSGMTMPTDESGIAQTQQFMPSGMTMPADESGIAQTQQFMPSGMTMPANESGIAETQQFMPSGMTMPADESGIFATQQQLPTPDYGGMEYESAINQINSSSDGELEGQALYNALEEEALQNMQGTNYLGIQDTPQIDYNNWADTLVFDYTIDDNNASSTSSSPVIPKQYGLDEAASDAYQYVTDLFNSDDSAQAVADSVATEPSIWTSVMETIANTAGMGFPGGTGLYSPENSAYTNGSGMTMPPSFINEPTGNTEGQDMYDGFVQDAGTLASEFPNLDPSLTYSESPLFNTEIQNALMNNQSTIQNPPDNSPAFTGNMFEYNGAYPSNAGSNAAIDAIVANSMAQDQAVAQASQASYTGPSIFTQPAAPAPVYAAPAGPPNRPSRVPSYTWKPSYAGGSGGF